MCDSFSIWFMRPIAETLGVLVMCFGFAAFLAVLYGLLVVWDKFFCRKAKK